MTPDGYYRTGDVFRRDADGFYYFLGRNDDMFTSGGENIWPSEVEIMLERHPAIRQAVVVPVPDELKGQKPVAFVVLRAGQHVDRGRDQILHARERRALPASAPGLVPAGNAARRHQQDRPQSAGHPRRARFQ